jgi:hypothetical protein
MAITAATNIIFLNSIPPHCLTLLRIEVNSKYAADMYLVALSAQEHRFAPSDGGRPALYYLIILLASGVQREHHSACREIGF